LSPDTIQDEAYRLDHVRPVPGIRQRGPAANALAPSSPRR